MLNLHKLTYNVWGEVMLLGDLQSKDVVNVVDGSKLGKITDMEIEAS